MPCCGNLEVERPDAGVPSRDGLWSCGTANLVLEMPLLWRKRWFHLPLVVMGYHECVHM